MAQTLSIAIATELIRMLQERRVERIMCASNKRTKPNAYHQVLIVDPTTRMWNHMDHDILINIIQKLPWEDTLLTVSCVCKSWLCALFDALFPPGPVLDLRPYDTIPARCCGNLRLRYQRFLKLMLNRLSPTKYSQLYLAKSAFPDDFYLYIAQRLPSLHSFTLPSELNVYICTLTRLIPCWRNLRTIHCRTTMVRKVGTYCTLICNLSLFGQIGDGTASMIARKFPLLERLVIQSCVLSVDALSIILDGHKNLILLDTQHCYCLHQNDLKKTSARAEEWKEEEIRQKAASVKTHLQCARKYCPQCRYLY